jgi:hypothetical protein
VSILAPGHDAWVVGDELVTVVDWGGAHVWAKADEHVQPETVDAPTGAG